MLVRAKETCFVDGVRRRKGAVFEYPGEAGGPLEAADGSKSAEPEAGKKKNEGPTRAEIMAQLDQAGVKYGSNDNKDALLALLEKARQELAPASSGAPDKSLATE